ncbi:hypothetical protein RCL1_002262 [Eukaryota sp. TZLM3-RCL]
MSSATGKVLLFGGFCILFPNHTGVVLSVDSRASVQCVHIPTSSSFLLINCSSSYDSWSWSLNLSSLHPTLLSPLNNSFIINTIVVFLSYLKFTGSNLLSCSGQLDIKTSLDPGFSVVIDDKNKLLKTGLGSSAAVTVALFRELIRIFSFNNCSSSLFPSSVVASLAHVAHNWSQGGIGSGFDIFSAVCGHSIFTRTICTNFPSFDPLNFDPNYLNLFESCKKAVVPSNSHLVLFKFLNENSSESASSPSLSRRVIKALEFLPTRELFEKYCCCCSKISLKFSTFSSWSDPILVNDLLTLSQEIRSLMSKFSHISGVEVIPKELEQVFSIIPTVFSHLPVVYSFSGAGGFDSFWMLFPYSFESDILISQLIDVCRNSIEVVLYKVDTQLCAE